MDKESFELLYLRFYAELVVYGRTLTPDELHVEDVIQELFVALWEKRRSIDTILSLESYLYISFRNNLVRRLRQRGQLQEISLTEPLFDAELLAGTEEEEIQRKEEQVKTLLLKLPPRQREVLFLRYYKNRSYQEIAEQLGISYQVARNFSYRAIRFLKKHLKYLPAVVLSILNL